jgi:ribosome-binding protein aMBF1 (putative translation factor)
MTTPSFTINRKRSIVVPEAEYRQLRNRRSGTRAEEEWGLPPLPPKLADGNYPALEYARASIARDLIRARRRKGLSQSALARRAGVRVETLNRVERAKITASDKIIQKLASVLDLE